MSSERDRAAIWYSSHGAPRKASSASYCQAMHRSENDARTFIVETTNQKRNTKFLCSLEVGDEVSTNRTPTTLDLCSRQTDLLSGTGREEKIPNIPDWRLGGRKSGTWRGDVAVQIKLREG